MQQEMCPSFSGFVAGQDDLLGWELGTGWLLCRHLGSKHAGIVGYEDVKAFLGLSQRAKIKPRAQKPAE